MARRTERHPLAFLVVLRFNHFSGWLVGWLVGWLDGWMFGWLDGWMVGWLVGWLVVCYVDRKFVRKF